MPAPSNALKQALKRVSQRSLVDRTAARLSSNSSCDAERFRHFSSASANTTSTSQEEELYGGKPSPISEYLNLAVQGVSSAGFQSHPSPERIVLKCGIPEDELTFKTASYQRLLMAPYVQHQEHKVSVSLPWNQLPLDDFEKRIMMEIVGSRYRPETNELRLSSEQFGSRIENKRHLTSMLDRLVFAARKLAKEADGKETTMAAEE
jgi:hypothetical protein